MSTATHTQPPPHPDTHPDTLLVSPRLSIQKGDFLGSGIPYWPLELAVLAAHIRDTDGNVSVLDLFGLNPGRLSDAGDTWKQGTPAEHFSDDPRVAAARIAVVYAISYMSHGDVLDIVRWLRRAAPHARVVVMENAQAVTAYSLQRVRAELFDAGAHAILIGDAWPVWQQARAALLDEHAEPPQNLLRACDAGTPRLDAWSRPRTSPTRNPTPAWELFPYRNYWKLPYAHGPKSARYLPVLTSRGCPYPCDFCVVPETNGKRWRPDDADAVVDQLIELRDRFGVRDFQVEDLNPTIKHERWTRICEELLSRDARIRFSLVSGTKAETVKLDQVPLFARAGCRFISISPESGSKAVMKSVGKPFDYDHGVALVRACRTHGIRTQACFLVGHPAEGDADREASVAYLRTLVRAGLDEAAFFIVAPFAGSRLHAENRIELRGGLTEQTGRPPEDQAADQNGTRSADQSGQPLVSFSPKGRADFEIVQAARSRLIRTFFAEKLRRGPDLWLQGLRAVLGRPQTKMENLPLRVCWVTAMVAAAKLARSPGPSTQQA